jgi:hypothetical protein
VNVIQMRRYINRDAIRLLRDLADAVERGDIVGCAVLWKTCEGNECSDFTGVYKANPAEGVSAAMRISWKLTQAQDRLHGPP